MYNIISNGGIIMFYKGVIRRIDTNLITGEGIEAIYRIINFGDIYFFVFR